jgi:hypothetical protein
MSQTSGNSVLFALSKWIITVFTILMVVAAALAGNGIFKKGTMEWLVVCYVLFTRKQIGNGIMLSSALVFLFTFGQIGLGYSTRSHMTDIVGWHIALGVLLTAATAMLATLLWMPANHKNGVNTAG